MHLKHILAAVLLQHQAARQVQTLGQVHSKPLQLLAALGGGDRSLTARAALLVGRQLSKVARGECASRRVGEHLVLDRLTLRDRAHGLDDIGDLLEREVGEVDGVGGAEGP